MILSYQVNQYSDNVDCWLPHYLQPAWNGLKSNTKASFSRGFFAEFSQPCFPCFAVYTILGVKTRQWSSLETCACQLFSEENSARKTCQEVIYTIEFTTARKPRGFNRSHLVICLGVKLGSQVSMSAVWFTFWVPEYFHRGERISTEVSPGGIDSSNGKVSTAESHLWIEVSFSNKVSIWSFWNSNIHRMEYDTL